MEMTVQFNTVSLPLTVVKGLCGLPYVTYEAGLQNNTVIAQP